MATNKKFKATLIQSEVDYSLLGEVEDTRTLPEQYSGNAQQLLSLFEAKLQKALTLDFSDDYSIKNEILNAERQNLGDIASHYLKTEPLGLLTLSQTIDSVIKPYKDTPLEPQNPMFSNSQRFTEYKNKKIHYILAPLHAVSKEHTDTPEKIQQLLAVYRQQDPQTSSLLLSFFNQPSVVMVLSQALSLEGEIFSYHTKKQYRIDNNLIVEKPENYAEFCKKIEEKNKKQNRWQSDTNLETGESFFAQEEKLKKLNPYLLTSEAFQKAMDNELDLFYYEQVADFVANNTRHVQLSPEQYKQITSLLKNSLFVSSTHASYENAQHYMRNSFPALLSLGDKAGVNKYHSEFLQKISDIVLPQKESLPEFSKLQEFKNSMKIVFSTTHDKTQSKELLIDAIQQQFQGFKDKKNFTDISNAYGYKGIREPLSRPILYHAYKALNFMTESELQTLGAKKVWWLTQQFMDHDLLNKVGSSLGSDHQSLVFESAYMTPKITQLLRSLSVNDMLEPALVDFISSNKEHQAQKRLETTLNFIKRLKNNDLSEVSENHWKILLSEQKDLLNAHFSHAKPLWKDTAFLDNIFTIFERDNWYGRDKERIVEQVPAEDLLKSTSPNVIKAVGIHKPQLLLEPGFSHFLDMPYLSQYFFRLDIPLLQKLYEKYPDKFTKEAIQKIFEDPNHKHTYFEVPLAKEPYKTIFKDTDLRHMLYHIFLNKNNHKKIPSGFWKDPQSLGEYIKKYPMSFSNYTFQDMLPMSLWKSQQFTLAVMSLCDNNALSESFMKYVPNYIKTFLKQSGAKPGHYQNFMSVVFDKFNLQQMLEYPQEDLKKLRYHISTKDQRVEEGNNPVVNKQGETITKTIATETPLSAPQVNSLDNETTLKVETKKKFKL